MWTRKKNYIDMINILAPLNIFAGTLTLTTQFVIPCSKPALQALFALASQLFIASLVALVVLFLLLYGFWDEDSIDGYRHKLVVSQLLIVGIAMMAAFFVLEAALVVAGNFFIGGFGIGLVLVISVAATIVGGTIQPKTHVRAGGPGPSFVLLEHDVPPNLEAWQFCILVVLYILEALLFLAVLVLGIWKAKDPDVGKHCNCNSTTSIS